MKPENVEKNSNNSRIHLNQIQRKYQDEYLNHKSKKVH